MKIKTVHSIAVCFVAFALSFLLVSCGNEDDCLLQENDEDAALYIKIAMVDKTLTKADTKTLLDNEKMHSVRVIVLHENGTIEHNKYYSLDNTERELKYVFLPVTKNETKKVYVFANEESVTNVEGVASGFPTLTAFFDSYNINASGFETAINQIYYTPDYTNGKNIPMSGPKKEVTVGQSGTTNGTFYVVRVATKFTVNFKNLRSDAVKVNSFSIEKYADKNFLMAHVNSFPKPNEYPTWIDWLKAVSEASSVNDNYEVTNANGWLTDYALPTQADITKVYTYNIPVNATKSPDGINFGTVDNTPVFYLPESKSNCDGQGVQSYTLTVNIDGVAEPFVCLLPNLKSLFRNTHVVIDVTCKNAGIATEIFVRPWNIITHEQIVL